LDILQNQSFLAIVGIIIAVITVIVTLLLYHLQKQKKLIGFRILSNTSLLSVQEEIKEDITILYKGRQVKQVQLIVIKFMVLGNISIKYEDFDTPIKINIGEDTQIISAEILDKNPHDIEVSTGVEDNKIVVVQPGLLNQGDTITVRILATNIGEEIKVEGRIAGVKEIKRLTEDSKLETILGLNALICISIGMGMYLSCFTEWGKNISGLPVASFTLIVIGFGSLFISSYLEGRNKKRLRKELEILISKTDINNESVSNT
jgi:ABC-type antimicrobial peptide transport system permease subunit